MTMRSLLAWNKATPRDLKTILIASGLIDNNLEEKKLRVVLALPPMSFDGKDSLC